MLLNRNLRVVVADDDETNLYILMKIMRDAGYNTKGFDGGVAAWKYLEKNADKVDLVILDKMMYDMSGLEVIKRMKSHPTLQYTPVMLQSGDTDVNEGLEAGADRYLMKPYKGEDLVQVVHELTEVSYGVQESFLQPQACY